ncbi:hypothetical protein F5876DRAFT_71130 [Lentinula aff. lateritia]|uniref:Uncharacterized protein n=1 Tax=Lentinula aff. lateritia TaxID=2804960 RepID=A0ACC1TGP9_9AGAR|nr:hypothetical protein F5876DRAFT_71130 [Lentinula aff. lateritia]
MSSQKTQYLGTDGSQQVHRDLSLSLAAHAILFASDQSNATAGGVSDAVKRELRDVQARISKLLESDDASQIPTDQELIRIIADAMSDFEWDQQVEDRDDKGSVTEPDTVDSPYSFLAAPADKRTPGWYRSCLQLYLNIKENLADIWVQEMSREQTVVRTQVVIEQHMLEAVEARAEAKQKRILRNKLAQAAHALEECLNHSRLQPIHKNI